MHCPKILNRIKDNFLKDTVFGTVYRSDYSALAKISNFIEKADIEFYTVALRKNRH